MAIDTASPRSRRALLGAGLGALAATAASALGGSTIAEASSSVVLGGSNAEKTTTAINNTATSSAAVAISGHLTHATGSAASAGVRGQDDGTNGTGIAGFATNGATARGVYGQSTAGRGVEGASASGIGVFGHSTSAAGVRGNSASGTGVLGASPTGYGVWGDSPHGGVYGHSSTGNGVFGSSAAIGASGVHGENAASQGYGVSAAAAGGAGIGVYGSATGDYGTGIHGDALGAVGMGVEGASVNATQGGYGVYGYAQGPGGIGVYGMQAGNGATYAGYFDGNLHVTGTTSAPISRMVVDHPDAPAERYYQQALVGSFEQVSTISGNAVTGADGSVTVKVPSLFARYHTDVRYVLTPLGRAPDLHIAQELDGAGRFVIASDVPGLRVSWLLTGVRSDPAALEQPLRVDAAKPARYRGRYIQPTLYGQPRSKSQVAPRPQPRITGPARHPKAPVRPR